MKKVIVTGGCGFIGSHTVIQLIKQGYKPVIIDNFSNSEREIYDGIYKITNVKPLLYDIDIRNHEALESVIIENGPIDAIIHFAAYKSVNESIEKSLDYYDNNLVSLLNALKSVKTHRIPKFIFSSSCIVYGSTKCLPVSEDESIVIPNNPYGKTKSMGETIIQDALGELSSTNCVILRYFNPIGNHESGMIGELPRGIPNNLVPYVLQVASGRLNELVIHGNDYNTEDGTCLRDYIHVMDLANAHVHALNIDSSKSEIHTYNVGTGKPVSVHEIIQKFEKVNKIKVQYRFGPRREGDIEKIWADSSKIVKELGWQPDYTVSDALKHAWLWEQNRKK